MRTVDIKAPQSSGTNTLMLLTIEKRNHMGELGAIIREHEAEEKRERVGGRLCKLSFDPI